MFPSGLQVILPRLLCPSYPRHASGTVYTTLEHDETRAPCPIRQRARRTTKIFLVCPLLRDPSKNARVIDCRTYRTVRLVYIGPRVYVYIIEQTRELTRSFDILQIVYREGNFLHTFSSSLLKSVEGEEFAILRVSRSACIERMKQKDDPAVHILLASYACVVRVRSTVPLPESLTVCVLKVSKDNLTGPPVIETSS